MRNLALLTLLLAVTPILRGGDVRVEGEWIFLPPPGSRDTAAFMKVVNEGKSAVRITGGETAIGESVKLMATTKTDGRMGMKDLPFVEVPAGGSAVLEPGGDHLMIYGLKTRPKPGERVPFTLILESGEKLQLQIPAFPSPPK